MTPTVKSYFLLHEAVALTGFTKFMLDYLAREKIFRPTGSEYGIRGRARRYSYADIVLLRSLHRICGAKGKIRHLTAAFSALRDEVGQLFPGQPLEKVLVVDGNELSIRFGNEVYLELRTGQLTFGFIVDLGRISEELSSIVTMDGAGALQLDLKTAAEAERIRNEIWMHQSQRRVLRA